MLWPWLEGQWWGGGGPAEAAVVQRVEQLPELEYEAGGRAGRGWHCYSQQPRDQPRVFGFTVTGNLHCQGLSRANRYLGSYGEAGRLEAGGFQSWISGSLVSRAGLPRLSW